MFAALNTMEPPIVDLATAMREDRESPWFADRLPGLQARVRRRLEELSRHLGNADWLDHAFSAGDLLMVTVLRRSLTSALLRDYQALVDYITRGETRPAYQQAFNAQFEVFTDQSTSGL